MYLKTNFNNNKSSKFISYALRDIKNQDELGAILKELKLKITDLWKSENIINLKDSDIDFNVDFMDTED